jgi:hypothetical protein
MMQAVVQRAGTGTHRAARGARPEPAVCENVTAQLAGEFSALSQATVQRWVRETWMCAEHLGLPVTDGLVEKIAREHLRGLMNSVPPSRRG